MGEINDRMFDLLHKRYGEFKRFADHIGVSKQVVNGWKVRGTDPPAYLMPRIAEFLDTSESYLTTGKRDLGVGVQNLFGKSKIIEKSKVPIYRRIVAGRPIEAMQEIIGYIGVEQDNNDNSLFGLQVYGDSMSPLLVEDDIVICQKQEDIESGQIGIIIVNGSDAVVKKVVKSVDGIMLVALNTQYQPIFYSNQQIKSMPVQILGKVIESRRKL